MALVRFLASLVDSRLREERGFTIIEVIVSALLVALVAIGGFAALDSAGATADRNKARNVAAALAQADQERLRGFKATQLSTLTKTAQTETKTVDDESYEVRSSAEWVTSGGSVPSCSSANTRAEYVAIESKVTWPRMRGASAVTSRSLKAIPNGSLPNEGSLAVEVRDQNGTGVSGLPISISGPQAASATTNVNGCVLLQHIPTGTYTVSFSRSGWILPKLPNATAVSDQVVVSGASTSSKSYEYGQAGFASVRFRTRAIGAGADSNTTGDRFTVGHTGMGLPYSKSHIGTLGATMTPSNFPLYPFTSSYTVWAGGCADAKPSLNGGGTDPTMPIPAGGTANPQVDIWEPTLRVALSGMGTSSAYRVIAYPTVSGCAPVTGVPSLTTTSASSGSSNADFTLPYGIYNICAQRTRSGTTIRKYVNNLDLDTRNGETTSISFSSGTSNGSCPTS